MLFRALLLFFLVRFADSRDTITWNQKQLKDVDEASLVSKESKFELGFFSPGNNSYRYVGIWYSQTRVSEKTVVWVANRNNPINDTSGVLTLNRYGDLVLYAHNMESSPVWSSNVSQSVQNVNTSTSSAQILDTGNLVVFQDDNNEIFIWQSFDHPTDTLIPGMKIGVNWETGQEWVLTSWKSQDDPGNGDSTLKLYPDQIASPQFFLYKGLSKYWRSDPWRVVPHQEETYVFLNETEAISRIRVNDSALEQLTWDNGSLGWQVDFSAPKSRCDGYGHCGANSRCSPDNVIVFECNCLPGYVPKSPNDWNQKIGSGGCVSNRVGASKCGNGDGFVDVPTVKYPDTSIASQLSMSGNECRQECLRNCSCTAYVSFKTEGLVVCLTWYDDLMDILEYTDLGQNLHVRVNATVLAANAERSQGFLERKSMLAIPILSAVLALVLIIMFAWWWCKKKRNTRGIDFVEGDELEETQRHPEFQFFNLDTIIAATDHFSHVNKLGHGGFGSVYKGQLPNEQYIAVKRLSKTRGQGTEEFRNEVAVIARLQHRNLVKLLGCCIKGEERMLVLEYMPNKSLDSFLFDQTRRSFLDWEKRFEIINGIARGILYLHQDSRLRIIHRDLKTSNVLLDAEMNPKVSDFGMARIFHGDQVQDKTSRIVGT